MTAAAEVQPRRDLPSPAGVQSLPLTRRLKLINLTGIVLPFLGLPIAATLMQSRWRLATLDRASAPIWSQRVAITRAGTVVAGWIVETGASRRLMFAALVHGAGSPRSARPRRGSRLVPPVSGGTR